MTTTTTTHYLFWSLEHADVLVDDDDDEACLFDLNSFFSGCGFHGVHTEKRHSSVSIDSMPPVVVLINVSNAEPLPKWNPLPPLLLLVSLLYYYAPKIPPFDHAPQTKKSTTTVINQRIKKGRKDIHMRKLKMVVSNQKIPL